MRARLILAAAAGALIAGLALAPAAEASHGWSFGAGFHVSGAHFRVGFGPAGVGSLGGPYFLTTQRLHYRGASCHGACFRRGAGFYHHPACSVVGVHFRRGGHLPSHYLHRYSPYRGPYGYGPGYFRPYGVPYWRDGHRHGYRRDHRGWNAPDYRRHGSASRYLYWDDDVDSDSDSDSDRRYRGRGRRH